MGSPARSGILRGIGDTAVQYGSKQFFLVFHLFPSSPAYPVAGHESDLVSQGFFKRVYIGIEVDVHVESARSSSAATRRAKCGASL